MAQARRRFARWRETRAAGAPIPDSLWAVAVQLTRQHGVHRTARALGLEYNKLKRLAQSTTRSEKAPESPAFVELLAPQPAGVSECRIELEGPRGGRMKIELPATASAALLIDLCRVVLGGAA
ncbi:MAG TPA: hypothetical protein VET51_10960 [Burkholderiales bacterium]|nr:hypothetical protein [Burkholderiales bacterium]